MAEAPPLLGIAGWSGSGKTTLVERLVAALTARGLRIATVKHTHHGLKRGDAGTDGARHARAGAVAVAVIGPHEWELSGEVQASAPPTLAEVVAHLAPADLVLVEGFKSAAIPKIEVRRAPSERPLADGDPHVIAVASDQVVATRGLPVFLLDDAVAIAEFIAGTFKLRQQEATMDDAVKRVVRECTRASDEESASFAEIVMKLIEAGVERYHADLVRAEKTYFLPSGGSEIVPNAAIGKTPAPEFSAAQVEQAVRAAQAGTIKYKEFCERAMAAGCVGYHVFIAGRRVAYYGRQGDFHVEWFPGAK